MNIKLSYHTFLLLILFANISFSQSLESSTHYLYYGDDYNNEFRRIDVNDTDGSTIELVYAVSNPMDVALDISENGGIFLLTTETVYKKSPDGTTVTDLFSGSHFANGSLRAIDIDRTNKRIYFTYNEVVGARLYSTHDVEVTNDLVISCDYDGGNIIQYALAAASDANPFGIAIKVNSSDVDIYWTDLTTKNVKQYNTSAGAQPDISNCCAGSYTPSAIVLSGSTLFWGNMNDGKIYKHTLGGADEDLYDDSGTETYGIDTDETNIFYSLHSPPTEVTPSTLSKIKTGTPHYLKGFEISDPGSSVHVIGTFSFSFKGLSYGGDYMSTTPSPDPTPVLVTGGSGTVDEGGTFTFSDAVLKADNPNGDNYNITYNITAGPLHGSIHSSALLKGISGGSFTQNDIANGKVSYTHDGSETTGDTLKFYLSDAEGEQSDEYSFLFTITPVNDPPVLASLPDITMSEDTPETIDPDSFKQYVTDPDTPESELAVTLTSLCPDAILSDLGGGMCELRCTENWTGSFQIRVTVNDGSTSVMRNFNVTVSSVNDLPVLGPLPADLSLEHAGNSSVTLSASDLETADSLLVFSAVSSDSHVSVSISGINILTISAVQGFEGSATITVTVQDSDGGQDSGTFEVVVAAPAVNLDDSSIPTEYTLMQNYPNPFNPSTIIKFGLPDLSFVNLNIYNLLGEKVSTLLNASLNAGWYEVKFDAENLPSGVYIYRISMENTNKTQFTFNKKMLLMK